MPRIFADPPDALSRRVPGLCLAKLIMLWLVTGSQSLLVAPINIRSEQYDTALAKWNSLHVAEYEQTVRFELAGLWHKWKVVVQVDPSRGNAVESVTNFDSPGD
jgi:hypothetical protein